VIATGACYRPKIETMGIYRILDGPTPVAPAVIDRMETTAGILSVTSNRCRQGRSGGGGPPEMKRTQNHKRTHVFQIIIEQDEAGYFVAECPALQACYTQGTTYEEVIENIKDVIALCLEDLKARKKSIPKQPEIIGVRRVEVSV
jgi:predicted RNase H-like HicB family nuclease